MNQGTQHQHTGFITPIIRNSILVVLLVLVSFIILTSIGILNALEGGLENDSRTILQNTSEVLAEKIDLYLRDARLLAVETNLDDTRTDALTDVSTARSLIQVNSDEIIAVRYIALTSPLTVLHETVNKSGIPIVTETSELPRVDLSRQQADPAFQTILEGSLQPEHIGEFYLLRDSLGNVFDPPRAGFSIYTPIIGKNGQPVAVVELEINTRTLLSIVNQAENTLFTPLTGRHLILMTDAGNILADSTVDGTAYLHHLESTDETSPVLDPLYDELRAEIAQSGAGEDWQSTTLNYRGRGHTLHINDDLTLQVIFIDNFSTAYRPAILGILSTVMLSLILGTVAYLYFRRRLTHRLQPVSVAIQLVNDLAGVTGSSTDILTGNTLESLQQAASKIESRVQELAHNVEQEQIQRQHDFQVTRRITQQIHDPRYQANLLQHATNMIGTELNQHYIGIYLLDESRACANLEAAYGLQTQPIETFKAVQHGSPTLIGSVLARGKLISVQDTRNRRAPGNEARQPETRSELALPLVIDEQLLGVLSIQSKTPNNFTERSLPMYQIIADQLATAIHNQRTQLESTRRMEQIRRLNQQLTADAWSEAQEREQLSENYGQLPENGSSITAPITVRGQLIGSLDAALPDDHELTDGDRVMLSAVAERVSLAIENARLFQETQHSLAETSTLYQLSRQLNETGTLQDILQVIIISVAPDAIGGQIWLFDDYLPGASPDIVRLMTDVAVNQRDHTLEELILRISEHPLLSSLTAEGITPVPDILAINGDIDLQLTEVFALLGVKALMIFPLNIRGRWKGFVSINFGTVRNFSESEQRIYNALVGQAGVAIDNRLLIEQTENALSRNEKLYAASRIINTATDIDDLVYAALATTNERQLNFWLALLEGNLDEHGWHSHARIIARSNASAGLVTQTDILTKLHLTDNSPMLNREPEIIIEPGYEIEDVPPAVTWMRSVGMQFMMIFPLFSENTPIALFYIVSEQAYTLTTEDYEVYTALTGQMSTVIQSQRFLESTRKALNDVQRLYVATRELTAATDMEELYNRVAGHLTRPFLHNQTPEFQISITLLSATPFPQIDAPELACVYTWHNQSDASGLLDTGTIIQQTQYPFGRMTDTFEENIIMYEDIESESTHQGITEILHDNYARTAIIAPLRYRQNWYGVLICRSNQPDLFDESYVKFMQAIAGQVAIAFERQELLAENERERRNLNDILSTLSAGVLVLDPNTLIPVQANEAASVLLGQAIDYHEPFSAERYNIYRTGTNLHYPNSELPIMLARQLNHAVPGDDLAVIFDGYHIDLQISASPIYDTDGTMKSIVAAFLDISNLRGLENTLQEQLRESVALYEALRSLSQSESLDELLDNILLQLTLQQPGDACILMVDENGNNLRVERQLIQAIEPIDLLRPVLLEERANYLPDVQLEAGLDAHTQQKLQEYGIRSLITLPMHARSLQIPIGWLVLSSDLPNDFSPEQERTLISISDMASTAIDNRYLMEQTEVALAETADLYDATTSISRATDIESLARALERGLSNMQPDMYAAYIDLRSEGGDIEELFSFGFEESIAAGMDIRTVVTARMATGDGLYVADITRSTLGAVEREIIKAGNIMSFAAVNLRIQDAPGGRLLTGYKHARRFIGSDARFMTAMADSASVVIDNKLLLEQFQSALQETSVLYQASRALIEVSTPEEIVDAIVNHLIEPHINQIYIMMLNTTTWDHPNASVEIAASWQSESEIDLLGVTLSPEQFPAWTQLSSPDVLTIHDIYDESLDLDLLEQTSIESLDTRSLVIIPLRVANRSIGAIWLGSREAHHYPDDRLRIFRAFSEQSSLSLEATRLLKQTEQRAAQLETSAVVSQSVGQILDLDVLLPQVVDLIKDQFNYDQVQVFLMDYENNNAVLRASTGEAGRQLLAIKHSLPIGSQSVIGQVTASAEPSIALDTADAGVIHKPNPYLPLTRSEMAMPLIAKNRVVGALDVQSNEPNAFTDEDIQALTTLAAQISVAIDNARLYEEAQRQAMDMNFLFDMTTSVAAEETINDALDTLAEQLEENLNAVTVAMYLPQVYADYMNNTITRLRVVTLVGQSYSSLIDYEEIRVGDTSNLIGITSETQQVHYITNTLEEPRYTPFAATARSAYLVPVSSGNTLISLIAIESARLDAFDTNTQNLVQTLARSLAAVIQSILLVEQLQESNEQLREVDRLKSQFLAAMSHELRTPLNSIIGFSRVMLKGIDGPLTEMQEQDLTTIFDSGNHLLNLVNDILDQAKLQENQLKVKADYFEVKQLVEGVKSIAIGYMKQKNEPLDLIVELAPQMPKAFGDEFRSRQIVMNLVTNAIKFTPEGSVTIRAYPEETEQGLFNRIDVIDTGIGISEDEMPILFEAFRQVDNSLTRTAEGTGLGLPISKALAELQGGELLVESEVGVGSIFSVLLPTSPHDEADEEDSPHEVSTIEDRTKITGEVEPIFDADTKPMPSETRKIKIKRATRTNRSVMPVRRQALLIEDNKDMVDQFRRILQKEGFEVQTADMPAFARAMVGTLRPTFVILDVNYAGGEGWQILKDLKEQDDTFDIPIIVSTMNPDSEEAYRLGANHYLQRPTMPEDLLAAVKQAEAESRRERILIIDDEPASIRLLSQVLGEYGNYRIFSAKNGIEGIALVARRRPDLIILDLRMPEMDGFAVLNELYNNPETSGIPVMVVTGDIDFNADEQEQLQHIHVLPKTRISQEEYEQFLTDVHNHLNPGD